MPVLTARGAGVRQRRRWLFRDLEVTVEPGDMVAVVGPPGSGRTTMLLALARRFRLSEGRVEAGGPIALGQVPEVSAPEPVFTVSEHVRERLALLGRGRRSIAEVDLHGLDPQAKGRDLTPYERQVLGLVLAQLAGPAVIALDGLDDGLDAAEQAALLRQLVKIAAGGTAVVLTARDLDPSTVTTVIHLAGHRPSALTADEADRVVGRRPRAEAAASPVQALPSLDPHKSTDPEISDMDSGWRSAAPDNGELGAASGDRPADGEGMAGRDQAGGGDRERNGLGTATGNGADAGVDGAPGVREKGVGEPEGQEEPVGEAEPEGEAEPGRAEPASETEPESEGKSGSGTGPGSGMGSGMSDQGEPLRAEGER